MQVGFALGALVWVAGCASPGPAPVEHAGEAPIVDTGPRCQASSESLQASAESLVVTGEAEQVESYCGGAARPQELRRALRRALACAEFVVRAGTSNRASSPIVARFATDTDGQFSVALAPGTYCVALRGSPTNDPVLEPTLRDACSPSPAATCAAVWNVTPARHMRFGVAVSGAPCAWECNGGPVPN